MEINIDPKIFQKKGKLRTILDKLNPFKNLFAAVLVPGRAGSGKAYSIEDYYRNLEKFVQENPEKAKIKIMELHSESPIQAAGIMNYLRDKNADFVGQVQYAISNLPTAQK